MASTKVFVGNFSFSVDDEKLKEFFSSVGPVTSAKVMTEGFGKRSRGFGFVEFASAKDAAKAIETLDGSTWDGRAVKVSEDRTQRRFEGGRFEGGRFEGGRFEGGGRHDGASRNEGGGTHEGGTRQDNRHHDRRNEGRSHEQGRRNTHHTENSNAGDDSAYNEGGPSFSGGGGSSYRHGPISYFRAQPFDLGIRRKRKVDPLVDETNLVIDYKEPKLLARFMSERGRILPRRMTGLTASNQRLVSRAIKRAQHIALMPFVTD